MAARAGADLLGLNFFPKSPRYIEPDAARDLCTGCARNSARRARCWSACSSTRSSARISITMEKVGLNFAQLSGDELVEMLRELRGIGFKAIRPRSAKEALDDTAYFGQFALTDERIPSLLLDAYHPQLVRRHRASRRALRSRIAVREKDAAPDAGGRLDAGERRRADRRRCSPGESMSPAASRARRRGARMSLR